METGSGQSSQQSPRTAWTRTRILALILVALAVISSGSVGLYYYTMRQPANTSNLHCSNGATNPPSCNACVSGMSYNAGACTGPCSNGATNPPNCNKYPPCTLGAVNPPNCYGYLTSTTVSCNPSTIMARITNSTCTVATYLGGEYFVGHASLDCQPHDSSGLAECIVLPPQECTLLPGPFLAAGESDCTFTVKATGLSLTVYATFLGTVGAGNRTLLSSSGSFSFTVIQPPSSVVVSGAVKSPTLVSIVTGIEFTTGSTNYRGLIRSGMYNVTLTNFTTYSVKISYNTIDGQNGNCTAGTLNLASQYPDLTQDYQCQVA